MRWIDQADLIAMARAQAPGAVIRELQREDERFGGRIEFLPVEEGLFCSLNHWRTAADTSDRTIVRNSIGLQFVQAGEVCQRLDGHGRYLHAGARVCLTTYPAETRQVREYKAGAEVKYVGAWIAPDLLVDRFGLDVEALPAPLKPFFLGKASTPISMSLPLSPRLWMALDDVFTSPFTGKLRDIYLRSKITELICEMTASLGRMGTPSRTVEEGALASHELMRIEAAAMVYLKELGNPPSVEALAAHVGLNRNRLSAGFRLLFDCTPHEYSRRVRLDWARRLISGGAMRLGEIAGAVGYGSQSAFSRAYANHFGFPPSEQPSVSG